MPLVEVVRAATATPARVIGRAGELGTLAPGALADVAVFELEQGEFDFEDADGNTLRGTGRLTPYLTIRDGRLWWKRRERDA
jgi:predicted amidohydrolase